MELKRHLPVVLLLSASDPDGSLGIQTDISVLSSLKRTYVTTVVTSYVVRHPNGQVTLKPVPPDVLRSQLRAAVETFRPDVVKIGLMADAVSVCEIAAELRSARIQKVVYGPCSRDEGDAGSLSSDTLKAVCCHLMPLVQLFIVGHEEAMLFLKEKSGNGDAAVKMTALQLSRCLVSTFHCSCYLLSSQRYDILATEQELFYYHPAEKPETESKQVENKAGVVRKTHVLPEKDKDVLEKYPKFMGHLVVPFVSAVAGCWAGQDDVKKPLYEAKKFVQALACRHSFVGENYASAPCYPLTDGGNYE